MPDCQVTAVYPGGLGLKCTHGVLMMVVKWSGYQMAQSLSFVLMMDVCCFLSLVWDFYAVLPCEPPAQPPLTYTAGGEEGSDADSERRKESNRRKHSKPGSGGRKPERATAVIKEVK